MPELFYHGSKFKVVFTARARETFDVLKVSVQPAAQFKGLIVLLNRYADGNELHAPRQINDEGNGFFAVKKAGADLRAYCWYCRLEQSVIVVSHFTTKKARKLSDHDKQIMSSEREKYYTGE